MKEFNRKRLTDLESKLMVARGEETVRELGMVMYTLLYLKWITNKDLLYSTGNSAGCHVAAWMERVWGRMDYMYRILEPLHCSPETITTLFIVYVLVLCLVAQPSPTLCNPMDCSLPGTSVHGDSPGKNTGVGYHALLQGIFPTQGLNPGLPHCRWILYQLSHKGSPIAFIINQ